MTMSMIHLMLCIILGSCLATWATVALLYRAYRQLKDRQDNPAPDYPYTEEQRCWHCSERGICPAYDTGCIYPCKHYKPDRH